MTAAKVVRFSFFFMGGGVLIDFRGGCVLFRGSWVFFFLDEEVPLGWCMYIHKFLCFFGAALKACQECYMQLLFDVQKMS